MRFGCFFGRCLSGFICARSRVQGTAWEDNSLRCRLYQLRRQRCSTTSTSFNNAAKKKTLSQRASRPDEPTMEPCMISKVPQFLYTWQIRWCKLSCLQKPILKLKALRLRKAKAFDFKAGLWRSEAYSRPDMNTNIHKKNGIQT